MNKKERGRTKKRGKVGERSISSFWQKLKLLKVGFILDSVYGVKWL